MNQPFPRICAVVKARPFAFVGHRTREFPNHLVNLSHPRAQMQAFGDANRYWFRYIGDWKHLRGQVMVEYRLRR